MRRVLGILLVALVVAVIVTSLMNREPSIEEGSVLVLRFEGPLEEAPPLDQLSQYLASGPAIPTVLLQLEKAAADERIAAVLLHIRSLDVGFGRVQELRDAVHRTRAAGKQVIALLDLTALNATREYYLASAADKALAVPGFYGSLAGISGEYLFLGGMFELAGIGLEYERIGEFKSAPESLAERGMSEPAREMMNGLLDGLFGQLLRGIGTDRGLAVDDVRALIDRAPSSAQEYMSAGLLDGIADRSEVLETVALGGAKEVDYDTYVRVDPQGLGLRDGRAIALVFGDGAIVQSRQRGVRRPTFSADRVAKALDDAAEDERVHAIVLRVNSGGGGALASDQIWRAVRRAREQKPVVISMADAAASGGYYVASGADAIVAEPATITGSIGVFVVRPELSGLFRKLEVGTETLKRGRFASLAGSSAPLTPEQRDRLQSFVRQAYDGFLERVSIGRGMPTDEIDKIGRGHVWLGEEAKRLGLVDESGGLWAAVARAKREAGIAPDEDPSRLIFPGPRGLGAQLRDLLQGGLRGWLLEELAEVALPAPLRSVPASLPIEGGIAYLPAHWIEFR